MLSFFLQLVMEPEGFGDNEVAEDKGMAVTLLESPGVEVELDEEADEEKLGIAVLDDVDCSEDVEGVEELDGAEEDVVCEDEDVALLKLGVEVALDEGVDAEESGVAVLADDEDAESADINVVLPDDTGCADAVEFSDAEGVALEVPAMVVDSTPESEELGVALPDSIDVVKAGVPVNEPLYVAFAATVLPKHNEYSASSIAVVAASTSDKTHCC
jgi:hypothetical protein